MWTRVDQMPGHLKIGPILGEVIGARTGSPGATLNGTCALHLMSHGVGSTKLPRSVHLAADVSRPSNAPFASYRERISGSDTTGSTGQD